MSPKTCPSTFGARLDSFTSSAKGSEKGFDNWPGVFGVGGKAARKGLKEPSEVATLGLGAG
jgi:hypothetical protein